MSVRLFVCLSICQSVCQSVSLSVCQSVSLSANLSVCLPICLSVNLSVCLSICQSVCQSVCLSICQSAHLSVYIITISTKLYHSLQDNSLIPSFTKTVSTTHLRLRHLWSRSNGRRFHRLNFSMTRRFRRFPYLNTHTSQHMSTPIKMYLTGSNWSAGFWNIDGSVMDGFWEAVCREFL